MVSAFMSSFEEIIGSLLNGDIFNDLHGPLTRFSRSWHF